MIQKFFARAMAAACLSLLLLTACKEDLPPLPMLSDIPDTTATVVIPRDTTTHDYTWQTWHFGTGSSDVLFSVSAINEEYAIAVGRIRERDADGKISAQTRSALRWDGRNWDPFYVVTMSEIRRWHEIDSAATPVPSLNQVWAELPNNWVFSNNAPIFWDGLSTAMTDWFQEKASDEYAHSAMRCFGNENNRWWWGESSGIVHERRRVFTPQPILSAGRVRGVAGNEHEAWAVTGDNSRNATVLRYRNGAWTPLDNVHPGPLLAQISAHGSVWCDDIGERPGGIVVMGGANLVYYDSTWKVATAPSKRLIPSGPVDFRHIHGSGNNNIWAVCGLGNVVHYNGKSWQHFPELLGTGDISYYGVWALEKRVFIVGTDRSNGKAIIRVGTRVG